MKLAEEKQKQKDEEVKTAQEAIVKAKARKQAEKDAFDQAQAALAAEKVGNTIPFF